jgi:hypothetical protein
MYNKHTLPVFSKTTRKRFSNWTTSPSEPLVIIDVVDCMPYAHQRAGSRKRRRRSRGCRRVPAGRRPPKPPSFGLSRSNGRKFCSSFESDFHFDGAHIGRQLPKFQDASVVENFFLENGLAYPK